MGKICTEYAFISTVKKDKIKLNFENTNYKWLNITDFIKNIYWFSNKIVLENVLKSYFKDEIYFKDLTLVDFTQND